MEIDGSCHCGNVSYEAEVDPLQVIICHCTDCQTLSGSAYRTVVPALGDSFKLLNEKPKPTLKPLKTVLSGRRFFAPIVVHPSMLAP